MKQRFTLTFLIITLLFSLAFLQGCKGGLVPDIDPTKGTLDFHRFISIGDGYSAGVTNTNSQALSTMGLYEEGQKYAFPQLLAEQFNIVEEVKFEQSLIRGSGSGHLTLKAVDQTNCDLIVPKTITENIEAEGGWQYTYPASSIINNLAIPLLQTNDILKDSLSIVNPFFSRLASTNGASRYIDLIIDSDPTFFTIWLGQEDILPYILAGASEESLKPLHVENFGENIYEILNSIVSTSPKTKGIVANIPDLTDLPYFSTVDYAYRNIDDCLGTPQTIYIEPSVGEPRRATNLDLILLPAAPLIGQNHLGLTPEKPLPNDLVLDAFEAAGIRNLISLYNKKIDSVVTIINSKSNENKLVTVDTYSLFKHLENGHTVDGLEISREYLTGGIFSLDGIYLTPRGNALVANAFIQAINQNIQFSAIIPTINITGFPGVVYP